MASTLPSKRKIIDIEANVFKSLSLMATEQGTNLKKLIEDKLTEIAEDFEDRKIYDYLVATTHPEDMEVLDDEEAKEFEKSLGL